MYMGKKIGVVVPAYNEEKLIGRVLDGMPDFVDKIIVVSDGSEDQTSEIVKRYVHTSAEKVVLIEHTANQGVGAAIISGYKWCRDQDIDIAVVMAGDAQMDPSDLPAILEPVAKEEADYTKGNRLISGEAWYKIPKLRYLGNAALTLLTKIASGYWHVTDSQSGFTATNKKVLQTLGLDKIHKRYGMPNDMLVRLNIYNFRVRDVIVNPIYDIGEESGIRPIRIVPKLVWLMVKLFLTRMFQKYVIRDFHPLVFFYALGVFFIGICFPVLMGRLAFVWYVTGAIPAINALAAGMILITGLQFILFAMWFDMEYNRYLR
jgi:glycosyltransferase involved in cell wall biosynthesis